MFLFERSVWKNVLKKWWFGVKLTGNPGCIQWHVDRFWSHPALVLRLFYPKWDHDLQKNIYLVQRGKRLSKNWSLFPIRQLAQSSYADWVMFSACSTHYLVVMCRSTRDSLDPETHTWVMQVWVSFMRKSHGCRQSRSVTDKAFMKLNGVQKK